MPAVRQSRYEFAPVEQDELGRLFLDVPDQPDKITLRRGATRHIAGQGDTLWTLAWKYYRSLLDREQDIRPSGFYFAIGWANDIVDPLAPLAEGSVIFVPSIEVLLGDVLVPPQFYSRNTTT